MLLSHKIAKLPDQKPLTLIPITLQFTHSSAALGFRVSFEHLVSFTKRVSGFFFLFFSFNAFVSFES
jgi:hypothetical protein